MTGMMKGILWHIQWTKKTLVLLLQGKISDSIKNIKHISQLTLALMLRLLFNIYCNKVQIFWENQAFFLNLPLFWRYLIASKKVGNFSNFCGLLIISELYFFFRGAIMRLKGQILLDVLRMKVILIMTCTWPY